MPGTGRFVPLLGGLPARGSVKALLDREGPEAETRRRGRTHTRLIYKGDGESEDHRASVAWPNDVEPEPTIKHFILRVGTFSELPNLIAKVTVSGDINDGPPLKVVFTGGSVRLKAIVDKPARNFHLTCPNEDTVTMTLTSQ